jgi:hypothetical protein
MPKDRIPKLIMEWTTEEKRKRGRHRKTWMQEVQAAMIARNLEQDQWRKREKWLLASGRRRQRDFEKCISLVLLSSRLLVHVY